MDRNEEEEAAERLEWLLPVLENPTVLGRVDGQVECHVQVGEYLHLRVVLEHVTSLRRLGLTQTHPFFLLLLIVVVKIESIYSI